MRRLEQTEARPSGGGWRRQPTAPPVVVGALIVASILLRTEGAGMWFWIDEALTVGIASQPLAEIPSVLRLDGSPPLYYLFLHAWMSVFGTGEVATHALSLTFATLCVPASYWAGRSLFDRRTALTAAALAAASPFLTHFAREARMYSLVTLLALLVAATFVHAFLREARWAAVGFGVSLTALLYTHNWGLYLAAATSIALVPAALAAAEPRRVLRRGVLTLAAVGLAYTPWVLVLLGQIGDTGAPWSFTPGPRQVVLEVAALVRDERVLFLLVAVVGAGLLELWRRPRTTDGATAWVLALLVGLPIGLGWAVSHIEPSWATRYLAVIVGPLLLLAAWGLARAGTAGVIALVLAVALWVQPLTRLDGGIRFDSNAKSDAKALAASIDRRLSDGDLVIVAQPEAVPLFAYYVQDDVRFATLWGEVDKPMIMDWRGAEARLAATNIDDHLRPLVATLEPGARIALVGPGGRIVDTDTDWIRTFHRQHATWRRTLNLGPGTVSLDRVKGSQQDPLQMAEAAAAEETTQIEQGPGPGSEQNVAVAVPFVADIYEVVASRSTDRT